MTAENSILTSIPERETHLLLPKLEPTILRKPQVLCAPDEPLEYAYFPCSGLVSLLSIDEAGYVSEVATVTRDGFIGPPVMPNSERSPYQIVVRMTGRALRIRVRAFREVLRHLPDLDGALLQHTHDFVQAVCGRVICHRAHTPMQRLSGWLLYIRSVAAADQFDLTQDAISLSVGLPRTVVTEAAVVLNDAGAISYRHGRIVVRDHRALSARACGCYRRPQHQRDNGPTSRSTRIDLDPLFT